MAAKILQFDDYTGALKALNKANKNLRIVKKTGNSITKFTNSSYVNYLKNNGLNANNVFWIITQIVSDVVQIVDVVDEAINTRATDFYFNEDFTMDVDGNDYYDGMVTTVAEDLGIAKPTTKAETLNAVNLYYIKTLNELNDSVTESFINNDSNFPLRVTSSTLNKLKNLSWWRNTGTIKQNIKSATIDTVSNISEELFKESLKDKCVELDLMSEDAIVFDNTAFSRYGLSQYLFNTKSFCPIFLKIHNSFNDKDVLLTIIMACNQDVDYILTNLSNNPFKVSTTEKSESYRPRLAYLNTLDFATWCTVVNNDTTKAQTYYQVLRNNLYSTLWNGADVYTKPTSSSDILFNYASTFMSNVVNVGEQMQLKYISVPIQDTFFDGMNLTDINNQDNYTFEYLNIKSSIDVSKKSNKAVTEALNGTKPEIIAPSNADNSVYDFILDDTSISKYQNLDIGTYALPDALPDIANASVINPDTDETIATDPVSTDDAKDTLINDPKYDKASIKTPTVTVASDSGDYGLFTLYKIDKDNLKKLSSYLWSSDFLDNFHFFTQDPSECLISLMGYPSNVSSSATLTNIIAGNLASTEAKGYLINNIFQSKSFGEIKILPYFNDFRDYAPYTKIDLYLPFVGMVTLNPDEVMDSTLKLEYRFELLSGNFNASIKVQKNLLNSELYNYSGNMAISLPLTSSNWMNVYSSILRSSATITSGLLTSNVGQIASGVTNIALNSTPTVRNGNLSGNSGFCSNLSAYAIITRCISDVPDNYTELHGHPTNKYINLSECQGFTKIVNIDLNISGATNSELEEITTLLQTGIIL